MQLAEKLLFEDIDILHQMKELIAELGPGIIVKCSSLTLTAVLSVKYNLRHSVYPFNIAG